MSQQTGQKPDRDMDPAITNPELYTVVMENEHVRVLEYRDRPGDRTTPHAHPDSVMYTLSSFRRRLVSVEMDRDVEMDAGHVGWLPAQVHSGENTGDSETHVLFVELKGGGQSRTDDAASVVLGPD